MGGTPSRNTWGMAVVILMTGAVVAGAIFVSRSAGYLKAQVNIPDEPQGQLAVAVTQERDAEQPPLIVWYTDLNCEFCRYFYHEVWLPVQEKYVKTNQVMAEARLFPIGKLYGEESDHVDLAYCLEEQGKFDEVLRLAFPESQLPSMSRLREQIVGLAADGAALAKCMEDQAGRVRAGQVSRTAVQIGVAKVPAMQIGETLYEDINTFAQADELIDKALAKRRGYE